MSLQMADLGDTTGIISVSSVPLHELMSDEEEFIHVYRTPGEENITDDAFTGKDDDQEGIEVIEHNVASIVLPETAYVITENLSSSGSDSSNSSPTEAAQQRNKSHLKPPRQIPKIVYMYPKSGENIAHTAGSDEEKQLPLQKADYHFSHNHRFTHSSQVKVVSPLPSAHQGPGSYAVSVVSNIVIPRGTGDGDNKDLNQSGIQRSPGDNIAGTVTGTPQEAGSKPKVNISSTKSISRNELDDGDCSMKGNVCYPGTSTERQSSEISLPGTCLPFNAYSDSPCTDVVDTDLNVSMQVCSNQVEQSHAKQKVRTAVANFKSDSVCSDTSVPLRELPTDSLHPSKKLKQDQFFKIFGLIRKSDLPKDGSQVNKLHRLSGGKLRRLKVRNFSKLVNRRFTMSRGFVMSDVEDSDDGDDGNKSPHVGNSCMVAEKDESRSLRLSPKMHHCYKEYIGGKVAFVKMEKLSPEHLTDDESILQRTPCGSPRSTASSPGPQRSALCKESKSPFQACRNLKFDYTPSDMHSKQSTSPKSPKKEWLKPPARKRKHSEHKDTCTTGTKESKGSGKKERSSREHSPQCSSSRTNSPSLAGNRTKSTQSVSCSKWRETEERSLVRLDIRSREKWARTEDPVVDTAPTRRSARQRRGERKHWGHLLRAAPDEYEIGRDLEEYIGLGPEKAYKDNKEKSDTFQKENFAQDKVKEVIQPDSFTFTDTLRKQGSKSNTSCSKQKDKKKLLCTDQEELQFPLDVQVKEEPKEVIIDADGNVYGDTGNQEETKDKIIFPSKKILGKKKSKKKKKKDTECHVQDKDEESAQKASHLATTTITWKVNKSGIPIRSTIQVKKDLVDLDSGMEADEVKGASDIKQTPKMSSGKKGTSSGNGTKTTSIEENFAKKIATSEDYIKALSSPGSKIKILSSRSVEKVSTIRLGPQDIGGLERKLDFHEMPQADTKAEKKQVPMYVQAGGKVIQMTLGQGLAQSQGLGPDNRNRSSEVQSMLNNLKCQHSATVPIITDETPFYKQYECLIPHMCAVCWVNDHMYCKNMKRVARDLPGGGGCLHYVPCDHFRQRTKCKVIHLNLSQHSARQVPTENSCCSMEVESEMHTDKGETVEKQQQVSGEEEKLTTNLHTQPKTKIGQGTNRGEQQFPVHAEDLLCHEEIMDSEPEEIVDSDDETRPLRIQIRARKRQIAQSLGIEQDDLVFMNSPVAAQESVDSSQEADIENVGTQLEEYCPCRSSRTTCLSCQEAAYRDINGIDDLPVAEYGAQEILTTFNLQGLQYGVPTTRFGWDLISHQNAEYNKWSKSDSSEEQMPAGEEKSSAISDASKETFMIIDLQNRPQSQENDVKVNASTSAIPTEDAVNIPQETIAIPRKTSANARLSRRVIKILIERMGSEKFPKDCIFASRSSLQYPLKQPKDKAKTATFEVIGADSLSADQLHEMIAKEAVKLMQRPDFDPKRTMLRVEPVPLGEQSQAIGPQKQTQSQELLQNLSSRRAGKPKDVTTEKLAMGKKYILSKGEPSIPKDADLNLLKVKSVEQLQDEGLIPRSAPEYIGVAPQVGNTLIGEPQVQWAKSSAAGGDIREVPADGESTGAITDSAGREDGSMLIGEPQVQWFKSAGNAMAGVPTGGENTGVVTDSSDSSEKIIKLKNGSTQLISPTDTYMIESTVLNEDLSTSVSQEPAESSYQVIGTGDHSVDVAADDQVMGISDRVSGTDDDNPSTMDEQVTVTFAELMATDDPTMTRAEQVMESGKQAETFGQQAMTDCDQTQVVSQKAQCETGSEQVKASGEQCKSIGEHVQACAEQLKALLEQAKDTNQQAGDKTEKTGVGVIGATGQLEQFSAARTPAGGEPVNAEDSLDELLNTQMSMATQPIKIDSEVVSLPPQNLPNSDAADDGSQVLSFTTKEIRTKSPALLAYIKTAGLAPVLTSKLLAERAAIEVTLKQTKQVYGELLDHLNAQELELSVIKTGLKAIRDKLLPLQLTAVSKTRVQNTLSQELAHAEVLRPLMQTKVDNYLTTLQELDQLIGRPVDDMEDNDYVKKSEECKKRESEMRGKKKIDQKQRDLEEQQGKELEKKQKEASPSFKTGKRDTNEKMACRKSTRKKIRKKLD